MPVIKILIEMIGLVIANERYIALKVSILLNP